MRNLLIAFLLSCALVGCSATSDEVVTTAYKSIKTSATLYDAVMSAAVDLHTNGVITDEQMATVRETAQGFYDSYMAAVDVLYVYAENKDTTGKEKVLAAIDLVKANVNLLLTLAESLGINVSDEETTEAVEDAAA